MGAATDYNFLFPARRLIVAIAMVDTPRGDERPVHEESIVRSLDRGSQADDALRGEQRAQGPAWYGALVGGWLPSLLRRGRSQSTIELYSWALRDFGRWLEHCRVELPQHLIPAVVESWQDRLRERQLSPNSRAVAATALRGLLRYGARGYGVPTGLWECVESVPVPEGLPRALEPAQLARILARYAKLTAPWPQLRDRALFWFLLTASCRISEVLALRLEDLQAGRLVVRQKGGREQVLIPSARARQWIQDYLRGRGRDELPWLWIRTGGRGRVRLDGDDANAIWSELAQRVRIPRFTSHALRHTGATELLERGASDTELQQHLGHRNQATLTRYARLRTARRQALVDQLDDLVPDVAQGGPAPRRRPRVSVIAGRKR